MTERLFVERMPTPIGPLLLTHDGKRLCNVEFEDREERRACELAHHFPHATIERSKDRSRFRDALDRYFKGEVKAIDKLPVAPMGTPFQRRAWDALRCIPPGQTRSYGDHARAIRASNAARAVGHANGANPVSIIVPCHRLVGANGALIRYGGGLERKQWLIDHERRFAATPVKVSKR